MSIMLLVSCTSSKNTSATRWYHSFNTRYNVYFNGDQAYQAALKAQRDGYDENYSEIIFMDPVSSLPKDKQSTGGPFDVSIEKAVKAIKTHSIQTKPKRNPSKRNDPKYQEFMNRTEYNPFLYKAWLLLGRSQYHNGDFLQSASTFAYTARIYNSQPEISNEARLWLAKAYIEMDWFYETEDILEKMDRATLNKKLYNLWTSVQADVLIKQKKYADALPFLRADIKAEKNKRQKARKKYLLGQVYTALGENQMAYQTFGGVSSAHAPYKLEFSAKIRQTEVYPGGNTDKSISQLKSMSKSSKNKDYLDQVYYALGNVYMSIPDTTKAIESYETGVEKSVQQGIDKVLNQIKLGDLYFEKRDYVKAQPNYAESLGQLKKGDDAYRRVSKRSEVLDELLIYYEAVILQDSLLRLSEMTQEEQLAIIDKIIKDLIKKEKEEEKNAEREEYLSSREEIRSNRPGANPNAPGIVPPSEVGAFYFYSTQAVSVGKSTFQQKWGRRKLEDDWRRRNKISHMSDSSFEELADEEEPIPAEGEDLLAEETSEKAMPEIELSSDPKDPQFYLQQIPVTEEDKQAAHTIIEDGLYNMAVIYKDKLEDLDLSLETFEDLFRKYPNTEFRQEAYYNMYMIYFRKGDKPNYEHYKALIRSSFPESSYAIAMADPDYEYNLRMMSVIQDSLYSATYEAYMKGDISAIRRNYDTTYKKYNQSKLMPKFMFLDALSYVQTNEADSFKTKMRSLIETYPDADVSLLASEMMKGFQRGLTLSGDGMLARGGLFNIRLGGYDDSEEDIALRIFSDDTSDSHLFLLLYPEGALNDNLLLYMVANYNFSNFQVHDFDLEWVSAGDLKILQVKPFKNQNEVLEYVNRVNSSDGYVHNLGSDVIILPISTVNYDILMRGKSLEEYMDFFSEHFRKGNEALIDRWNLQMLVEPEEVEEIIEEEEISSDPWTDEEEEESTIETALTEEEVTVPKTTQTSEPEETQEIKVHTEEPVIIPVEEEDTTIYVAPIEEEITEEDPWADVESIEKEEEYEDEEEIEPILEDLDPTNPAHLKDYVKQQERLEKELKKQQAKEAKEREKQEREEKKRKEKEKKDAKKQKEQDRKNRLKQKEQERKDKQKVREEERKQKEKTRKENQKIKEQQRKDREKEREKERKRKEQERKAKQKGK